MVLPPTDGPAAPGGSTSLTGPGNNPGSQPAPRIHTSYGDGDGDGYGDGDGDGYGDGYGYGYGDGDGYGDGYGDGDGDGYGG